MSAWDDHKKKKGYVAETKQTETSPSRQEGEASAWGRHKASAAGQATQSQLRQNTVNNEIAAKKGKNALRYQKSQLQTSTPSDADWAGYYANETAYNSQYGKSWQAENSYQRYKAAMDRVNAAYDAELAANQRKNYAEEDYDINRGVTSTGAALARAEARMGRDTDTYNRMAEDAARIGSQTMWEKANAGYNSAVTGYTNAYNKHLDDLKANSPGVYYGVTKSGEELQQQKDAWDQEIKGYQAQIDQLNSEIFALEQSPGNEWDYTTNTPVETDTERQWTVMSNERNALQQKVDELQAQADYYDLALKYQANQRGLELEEEYLSSGKLKDADVQQKVAAGKQKYDRDIRDATAYANSKNAAKVRAQVTEGRPMGGSTRTEMKRYMEEWGLDRTLLDAANLQKEDADVFYALYAEDPDKAKEWIHYIDLKRDQEFQQRISEMAEGQGWMGAYVNLNAGTVARMMSGAANVLDPYGKTATNLSRTSEGLLGGSGQFLNEKIGVLPEDIPIIGGKGAGEAYQLASSIIESTAVAVIAGMAGDYADAVSAIGVALMGSSAAVSDYNESIQRGLTRDQASQHALAAGIAEAAFEYLSVENLINWQAFSTEGIKAYSKEYWKQGMKQWFTQSGVEASEEFFTSLANRISDGYLARQNGYDSSIEQRMKELMAIGVGRKEAEEKAEQEWITELINDAIGGYISGGFSGGLQLVSEYAMSKNQNRAWQNQTYQTLGETITQAGEAKALQSYAAANEIAFDQAAAQGVESRQPGVTGGIEGSTLAQQAEQAAQTKQTHKERRQERKSNRSLGAVQEQVVSKLADNVRQAGLNNAQSIYDQQVAQHGEGISRFVQAAVASVAAEQFAALSSDSMEKANAAYRAALDGTTSQPVRNAIRQGYDMAVEDAAYSGSTAAQSRYLQDKLTGWGQGGALNLNAETTTKDGKTEQVQIADLGNEKGKVKLTNGQTVFVKSLQGLDADVADVIQQADRFDLGAARSLMWRDYQLDAAAGKVTDGVRWIMSYALAFDQGRRGIKTLQDAQAMSSLDEDVVRRAYQQGAEATEEWRRNQLKANEKARAEAPEGVTGKKGILDTSAVSEETMKNLSEDKKQALKTIETLANGLGVDFRIVTQTVDEKGNIRGWQGKYNLGENTIEIDINAGINNIYKDLHTGILAVTGHELTHWMQENAPTEYLAYKRAVLSAIENGRNGHTTLERLIDQVIKDNKKNGLELTRSQAEDEVVADASMKRLGDQEFWETVSGNLGEQKQGVVAKLKEFFSKFFAKIREIIGKTSHMAEAAQLVDQAEKAVQDTLRKLYAEGIGAAMRGTSGQTVTEAEQVAAEKGGAVIDAKSLGQQLSSRTDSTGRELTEAQQEYFKDSAIRDSKGRLLTIYHGTSAEFTVFDPVKYGGKAGTGDGYGIYLTDKKEIAAPYGDRIIEGYANIKKPAYGFKKTLREAEIRKLIKQICTTEAAEMVADGEHETVKDALKDTFVSNYVNTYQAASMESVYNEVARRIYQSQDNDVDLIYEIMAASGRMSYRAAYQFFNKILTPTIGVDGFWHHAGNGASVILAVNSNQVKNADNKNPTPNPDIRYSLRDYSEASDLELMENAAEYLSEAGGEEYWKALLKSAPELENQSDEVKRLLKDFQAQAKKLEAARREMTLTQRKLNTTGISGVVKGVMQYFTITDAKKNGIVQKATQALTEGYQEALNAVDKGKSDQVLDITYNAAVNAAEILLTEGRITQNYGGKWSNVSAETRLGEDRQQVIDQMVAAVGADFALNRYRDAIPETAADRLVARTQREMQKKVDAQKEKNAALTAENQKLTRENEWVKAQADAAKEHVGSLNEQLQYLKDKLADSKSMSSKERAKLRQQARNLNNRLQAAKEEAKAWKARAEAEGKLATQYGEKQAALLKKLQAQQEREQKILEGKLRPLAMQRLLRAVREAENKKVTQHKDEVFAKYKDNQKASQLRSRIKNLSDEMKRAMTKPTDGSYVPAALYGSMTKLADALDDLLAPNTGTKAEARYRAVMDQIHALSAEYRAVQNMDDPVYSSEYDEEIQYQIDELVKTLQGANADEVGTLNMTPAKARELTTEELQKAYNILKYINYCMKTAKDMMSSGQFKSVYDAMRSIADQQQAMRSMNSLGRYGKMKRSRMLDSMNVMRAVEMMSNWDRDAALYQIMHQVEQGVVRSDAWMMDYNKSLQDLKTGKNEKAYREALTKKLDYSVTDKEGLPVKMTKMQAIQILMTAEREAANDKLVHLQKGGAVIRDALKIQDGKAGKASEQYIKVTPELIQRIQNSLTEWDKAYIKTIRAYIAKEAKATNEVMYALKHRVMPTEPNYVPYIVDKNYLDTKLDSPEAAMSMWVKTPRSVNPLKQKAGQPVIIDGMDTVMAKHVKEIADYIGLALPIRDFSKVYNGKLKQGADENPLPVKKTIDRNWAKKGQHLLTQSIIDVQGGSRSQSWSTAIAEHLNGLQSAFVKSALLINPSVTIKQAASYVAAGSILSRAALEMANHPVLLKNDVDTSKAFDPATGLIGHIFLAPNGKTATRIYNEIDKYTSMHYQRRQGMSQYELANEANRSGPVRRKVNAVGANMEQNVFGHAARKVGASLNPVSWIQRMDVATTATLWLACKEQAKMDGLTVNSQEYWQRTTELYERVLRETQPMYDSLHRTAFQKSHGEGLMQYLFPFRTVPVQNHGQLAAAYETLQASKNKSTAEKKAAAKFFRKTVWAQTESAIVFSLMTFIAAALKRKTKKYRDEDEEMGILSVLKGLTQDTAGTLFSVLFPIMGSALWDTGSRLIDKFKGSGGYTYDPFSVGVVDLLNDFAGSFDKIAADVGKMFRGEKAEDFWNHGLTMILKAAKLAGIPADTIKTYWQGIKGNVEDIAAGRVPALNDESWERSAAVNAERYVKALEAGDQAKADAVLAEMKQNILAEKPGLSEKKLNAKISSAVQSYVKEMYLSKKWTEAKATEYMVKYGTADDENDAYWMIRKWDAREAWDGLSEEFSWTKYDHLRELLADAESIDEEMEYLQDHGVRFVDANKEVKAAIGKMLQEGEIDEKDAIKMLQLYHKTKDDKTKQYRPDTADEAWMAVQEWSANIEHEGDEAYNWTKYEDLYAAMDSGADIEPSKDELMAHGIEEKTIKDAVVDHVKDLYQDGEIDAAKAMKLLQKYRGMEADEAYWKVDEWDAKTAAEAGGEEFNDSNYRDLYAAIDANKDAKAAMKELTDHGYKERDIYSAAQTYLTRRFEDGKITETQLKNQLSRYAKVVKTDDLNDIVTKAKCYKETGYRLTNLNTSYLDGEISADKFKQIQTKYGGMSTEDTNKRIRWLDVKKANPDLDVSEAQCTSWYDGSSKSRENGHESAKSSGMSIDAYIQAKAALEHVKDSNGNGTGEDEYIAALKKLDIPARQKAALYYEKYKGTTKYSVKWY